MLKIKTDKNMRSFLKLEVVWKDDDMFELKVVASNDQFSGTTTVYEQRDLLHKFADSLVGFPKTISDSILFYEAGQKDSYAYFSMRFYMIAEVGNLGVQVTLERNVATKYRIEEKDKLTMEILTKPGLIDSFARSLLTLAKNEEGQAILEGID
jgi:hypothetical protein